jgi:hypothetical protein
MSPARFREALSSALRGAVRSGGHLTWLFHPFLEEHEERFEIMRAALDELRELAADRLVWCAPYSDVVPYIRERPEAFGEGLQLDLTEA